MKKLIPVLIWTLLAGWLHAQEVFFIDFESALAPEDWMISEHAEWGQELGVDDSRYFRFHPASWRDELESPVLSLTSGYYVLYFSWNEAGTGNPDLCNIRWKAGSGPWQTIAQTGGGNERQWQRDSVVLGNLEEGDYALQFEYQSLPRFPSQYFNLDNVQLVRRDAVVTAAGEELPAALLQIGPVPAGHSLNVSLNDPKSRVFTARILNMHGEVVLQPGAISGANRLDISGLPAGTYILELQHGTDFLTRKFLHH